jgi:hypothetical protein
MLKKAFRLALILSILGLGPLSAATRSHYKMLYGPKDFYYGHISLVDIRNDGLDPVVLRSGAPAPEPASLNLPIGPGDTIRTSSGRRVEIQFDNATIIRLDKNSELLIETILAPSLSSPNKLSNLSLRKGRMHVTYKQFDSREMFQVLTPKAAFKLKDESVATIGLNEAGETEVRVKIGKGFLLYGTDPQALKELAVASNEKAVIGRSERPAVQPYGDDTDFDEWNRSVNDNFVGLHEEKTTPPRQIQKLPWAVHDFARKFGNQYGEWIKDDKFGYVWRPYDNDVAPHGSWAPYFAGRWSNYGGQMFWVSSEPWGWIPYHLGLWQRDEKKGWIWLPGTAFAPAWVEWSLFGGNFWVWKPWSLHDWGFYMNRFWYDEWYGGGRNYWAWNFRSTMMWQGLGYLGGGAPPAAAANTMSSTGATPTFPLLPEFKTPLKHLRDALQRRDPEAIRSLLAQTGQAAVVDRDHLNSTNLRAHAVPLQAILDLNQALPASDPAKLALFASPLPPAESLSEASRAFQINARMTALSAPESRPLASNLPRVENRVLPVGVRNMEAPSAFRRIDWNPDVRLAQKLGVDIRYSSFTNEVRCPQLNISSYRPGGPGGSLTFSAAVKTGEWSGGQISVSPAEPTKTSQAVSTAASAKTGSTKGSEGERIKN